MICHPGSLYQARRHFRNDKMMLAALRNDMESASNEKQQGRFIRGSNIHFADSSRNRHAFAASLDADSEAHDPKVLR
jgi:hypothetical protein